MSPGWLILIVKLLVPAVRSTTSFAAEIVNLPVHGATYPGSVGNTIL